MGERGATYDHLFPSFKQWLLIGHNCVLLEHEYTSGRSSLIIKDISIVQTSTFGGKEEKAPIRGWACI